MSKTKCELIQDLLPLYAENMCSEESRRIVAEHLAECTTCKAELEKMSTDIHIRPDDDISVIKRIKKRILIEKIGITAAIVLFLCSGMWMLGIHMLGTTCHMNYKKYGLDKNVWVEEDADGTLWFVQDAEATAADSMFPTIRDAQGRHIGYDKDFDKNTKEAYGITLDQIRIKSIAPYTITMKQQRFELFNKNEKPDMQQVFYYDADNNREIILWERS